MTLRLEGPTDRPLGAVDLRVAPQTATRFFLLGEVWEAAADREEPLAALCGDGLADLPPGDYRLVGEVWEDGALLTRGELALRYLRPVVEGGRDF